MKKTFIFFTLMLFLFLQTHSKMTETERTNLLNRLTKKISFDNSNDMESLKNHFFSETLKDTINYDRSKIEEILNKYGLPQNYNFLEEKGIVTRVKDQQSCGCCWSHSATSALAYRFQKHGVDVDLSPQDAISCYLKDCDAGNYLIDSDMNLIKNGTVTEGCLPFSSGDGKTIEECPTTCKDGSTFRKYYAQNAYMTEDYYSKDTFYEIVALIMDQLVNNGPVVTGIDVFEDFILLHRDPELCHNQVYTYDGKSEYLGGHAVAVVGYGYMNSKYYWLLQNSWGEYACDNGFVKVEFGQIGVEQVAFVEPYLGNTWPIPIPISISLSSFDKECKMDLNAYEFFDSWVNTLEIGFKNPNVEKTFIYHCSRVSLIDGEKDVCYFQYYNYFTRKGTYTYSYHNSLGNDNSFYLNNFIKEFYYYGIEEYYDYAYSNLLFVSQEGSKIILYYSNDEEDKEENIPSIYANENSTNPLSDCHYFKHDTDEFVYCDLKQNEVDSFDSVSTLSHSPLTYNVLCGAKEEIPVIVYKLDTTKYPIFKVKKILLPQSNTISSIKSLTLIADIEGSLSGYHATESVFYGFIDIEVNPLNLTAQIKCTLKNPRRIMKDYVFSCYVDMTEGYNVPYDNIYLHPINMPENVQYPYEVYIKDVIKAEKYDPQILIPKIQVYIESLCPDCVNFITKSFKDFYEKVKKPNLVDIEFIPYGNAHEVYNSTTKKYDFTCQHGELECYGNLVETCAIQILGKVQSYSTILCIESNIAKYNKDFDRTLEFCLSSDQTSLQEIKECVKSDLGNYYEHQMAQKTDVNHMWVPWVVVNGYHDENEENEIIESLIDFVCGDDKTKCY